MRVQLVTTLGVVDLELYSSHAPKACRNFKELARAGYYDGTEFHRIVPGFCVQGGDPTGTGRGGASFFGAPFEDEVSPALKHTGAGVLSMANAGPNTNRSQFFITLGPSPSLDKKHTIFGRVCGGMATVAKMGLVPVDSADRPREAVRIIRAVVSEE